MAFELFAFVVSEFAAFAGFLALALFLVGTEGVLVLFPFVILTFFGGILCFEPSGALSTR